MQTNRAWFKKHARSFYLQIGKCDNRGRTWSAKRFLSEKAVRTPEHCGPYYNCARISRLKDGRLAIVCDLIKGAHENAVENTDIHLWFSSDDGESWEGPILTPATASCRSGCMSCRADAGCWRRITSRRRPDPYRRSPPYRGGAGRLQARCPMRQAPPHGR